MQSLGGEEKKSWLVTETSPLVSKKTSFVAKHPLISGGDSSMTVTENSQEAVCPLVSVTELDTTEVPIGNVAPLLSELENAVLESKKQSSVYPTFLGCATPERHSVNSSVLIRNRICVDTVVICTILAPS